MADCPGVLHLALMADGGLARLRVPGGRLTAAQARAVAEAAARFGSGVVDLTNRANLQIRGLAAGVGETLVDALVAAGFAFEGEADRCRNILLDPYSGLDRQELRDMRPIAEKLDDGLKRADWIGDLCPKASFVLDGAGQSGVAAVASDVAVLAMPDGFALSIGGRRFRAAADEENLVETLLAVARATARLGPESRASALSPDELVSLGLEFDEGGDFAFPEQLIRRFGVSPTQVDGVVSVTLPIPVGRLDPKTLGFLADATDDFGDGALALAPWSAVVVPRVREARAGELVAASCDAGFTPVAIAERLTVIACAGAPGCERAREPAKSLAQEALALAAREPERLPDKPRTLHLSACAKGCAGSAPADILLLGSSEAAGWNVHRHAAPRRAGRSVARLDRASACDLLALVSGQR